MTLKLLNKRGSKQLTPSEITGKVVLVTGGSRGIGAAVVRALHELGAKVVFSFQTNQRAAEAVIRDLGAPDAVRAFKADSADRAAMKELVAATVEEFGRVDALINCAGIAADKAMMMMSDAEWQRVIDTNLTGTFNACRSVIVPMMKQRYGRIINLSSVSGLMGLAGQVNYAASKAGIFGLTRALAKEVAAYGITVNALAPGYIETDMLDSLGEKKKAELLSRIPVGRFGTADEVAVLVCNLLGEQAGYITGQTLVIDGGLSLG